MQILVRTDNNVQGSETLTAHVTSEVEGALQRFGTQITRVEVHLGDVNSHKEVGDDKRCLMEARLAGLDPVAASHQAPTLDEAIAGCADTLQRNLDRLLGKLDQKKGRTSFSGE